MNLANRIRQRMSELQLTQEGVANRADISQGMVYKLVSGKAKNTSKIVQLARALECEVEWLATGQTHYKTTQTKEEKETYKASKHTIIDDLKAKIRALPASDQKALAMEIMDELLSKS